MAQHRLLPDAGRGLGPCHTASCRGLGRSGWRQGRTLPVGLPAYPGRPVQKHQAPLATLLC